jgi:hypothetical protein
MKKYSLFSFFLMPSIMISGILMSCPCMFSPDDQQPFFEQYEDSPNQEEIFITTPEEEK